MLIVILIVLGICTGAVNVSLYFTGFCIYTYSIFFVLSLGCGFWAFMGEAINDICLSIGISIGIAVLILLSIVFPFAVQTIGISNSFFIFAGFTTLGVVYEYFELFETKGKTKPEIQKIILLEE